MGGEDDVHPDGYRRRRCLAGYRRRAVALGQPHSTPWLVCAACAGMTLGSSSTSISSIPRLSASQPLSGPGARLPRPGRRSRFGLPPPRCAVKPPGLRLPWDDSCPHGVPPVPGEMGGSAAMPDGPAPGVAARDPRPGCVTLRHIWSRTAGSAPLPVLGAAVTDTPGRAAGAVKIRHRPATAAAHHGRPLRAGSALGVKRAGRAPRCQRHCR